jgi:Asp-tRNA(Asn)/Glu-tRNA(Gln) amidotransferase A subunit family amidase
MSGLIFLSAMQMAEGIRNRDFSPRELLEAHLTQIERVNPLLNAIVNLDGGRAMQTALDAERAVQRGPVGSMHGVPVTIKSSIDAGGLRCEAGTRLRAGHIPKADAALVARLKAAGAIVLGTTNTPELLMAYQTDNLMYGRTNNPWNLARSPGGSSGGESAAIAAGCSAGGIGSDGGGSIRVPAHFCGICGLKPTPGRIPSTGHYPPSGGPFSLTGVVGPMARTVDDLKMMFEIIAHPDEGDVCSSPVPIRWPSESDIRRMRVGYFEDDGVSPVTPETRDAVRRAVRALLDQGFEVEPFRPDCLKRAGELWWIFFVITGGLLVQRLVAGREAELSRDLREFLEVVSEQPPLTRDMLLEAWIERDSIRTRLLEQMKRFPILLCPVCSIPAFDHSDSSWRRSWMIEGKHVSYSNAMSYSQWCNITGNPAAVVPVGCSPEGLPIGVQIIGRPHEEELVLSVSKAIESAIGGYKRPPMALDMASWSQGSHSGSSVEGID